jgi:acetyl esterase/lipase
MTSPAPQPATRSYGEDPAQVYDVRPPSAGATPRHATVLVVHGGFWRASYDRAHAAPEVQAFADAGYAVAVAEYRRVGMPGGGVPGTLDDVHACVTAVLADVELPKPVVVVGHSAGGHLATWVAGQHDLTDVVASTSAGRSGPAIAGIVSLAGVVDLDEADRLHLGDDAARDFVGSGPGSAAWEAADPMAAPSPAVPVRLIWGSADDVVPPEVGDRYLPRVLEAGGEATSTVLPGVDHHALIDPESSAFSHVLTAVAGLLPRP